MTGGAWYNEIDPYAAQWLRNLIAAGLIAPGVVDERSVVHVRPDDLMGFEQCHFFAGIAGWPLALALAGWPAGREVWTGSCPCQPLSSAGQQKGHVDARHLWPTFFGLIAECRPATIFGEQVGNSLGLEWFSGVRADLETIGYACGAAVVPACAVGAPHRRDRLWFMADAESSLGSGQRGKSNAGRPLVRSGFGADSRNADRSYPAGSREPFSDQAHTGRPIKVSLMADADEPGSQGWKLQSERENQRSTWANGMAGRAGAMGDAEGIGRGEGRAEYEFRRWRSTAADASIWISGADGKARLIEPGIRLLAHGIPARVAKLRALGNAIVPQVAAEVIGAFLECRP